MALEMHKSPDVFVSGAFPSLTFNERLDTDLKKKVTDHLRKGGGRCLLVHGSSKTGKTVFVERWLPPTSSIWIKGDEISSVTDLYQRIIDDLGLFTEISKTDGATDTVGGGAGVEVGAGILKFRANASASAQYATSNSVGRSSLNVSVVKAALRDKPVPIVIDDFHFMDAALRLDVAKAVKDLIRITRVILIAIPHATFEPLQQLPDMDWRVDTLQVKAWESNELAQIAKEGFSLLGVVDHDDLVGTRLSIESRGAPAIMQTLCLEYVTEVVDVWETAHPAVDAREPNDWRGFLSRVAEGKKPSAFDAFVAGKEVRGTDRAERALVSGEVTDIYGAVLYTLAKMGAHGSISKFTVADEMQKLMKSAPTASTISGTLTHLADIAESVRGHSDPALTYQDPQLQLLDPYLSFFLAHGDWILPQPKARREGGV